MKQLLWVSAVFCLAASTLLAQSVTSLNGTVSDPSGAVIPKVVVKLHNTQTGVQRETSSDDAGRYLFAQVLPGTYRVTATAQGFNDVAIEDVRLLVNSPTTVNIAFTKVGAVAESVSVSADAVQVNTTDASIGNALSTRPIQQLPLEARNVVGLLALQPGVTYTGQEDSSSRNGAVNGGKSDQANVTLDGVDVNDQQNRSAFTSVLRVTLDSVQEFRVTTANANADQGRSSGAQVALITKNGSNEIHGSAYEFHRNTITTANSFFNNMANVGRPKLIRNVFGASVGGPAKKNRLFYFFNFEGRRDAKENSVERVVPNMNFRQGIIGYQRKDPITGVLTTATFTPDDIKARDPLGIGVNPNILKVLQAYPTPNSTSSGDGYNTAGFRFIAPRPLRWNTYITRWDYNPTDSGRHALFLRANLQNDRDISVPQFPGEQPNSVNLNNSKGLAAGYNLVARATFTGAFRYGFTRQGVESSGTQVQPYVSLLSIDDLYGFTTAAKRIIPVHNESADFNYVKGAHTIQFGGSMRQTTNSRDNYNNSFSSAQVRASRLRGSGSALDPTDLNPKVADTFRTQVINLLGIISTGTAKYNYDLAGDVQPAGSPVSRNFKLNEYEMYVQDAWRLGRSLTVTAGVRYSLSPPIYERDGIMVTLNPSIGDWFNERGSLAAQGKPVSQVTPLKYVRTTDPGSVPLYPFHKKNFAPRLAIAYSPQVSGGFWRKLFGAPGQTAIRAGWGMFYDAIGNSLILRADTGGYGLSTSINSSGSMFDERTGPRYTTMFDIPAALLPPAPHFTFPVTAPETFQYGSAVTTIDSGIRPPYTMNMNFSIGREFKHGLFIQGSYVGRLSRRSLAQTDPAAPSNNVDPASGVAYYEAATQLARLAMAKVPVAQVQPIPYWENLWNGTSTLTPTQAVYSAFLRRAPDFSTALEDLDRFCDPVCGKTGKNFFFDKQIASITTWRSIAGGNYHAMQWTIRQRFTSGLEFGFNYTLSRSIDLSSRAESDGTGPTFGFITNPWMPWLNKAVSDYDMTHQWNAHFVAELPFGRGKALLNDNSVLDAIFGGWQISGIYRQTTGMPMSVSNGRYWPTNYQWQGFATTLGPIPGMETTKNAPSVAGAGGPNIFSDPAAALSQFGFTWPGGIGSRNVVRGDGYFTIDSGVSKTFTMPYSEKHKLQIRWETFNLTNSVRFDISSLSLSLGSQGTFGKYSDVLTQPRVMQFGARYEF